MTLSLTRGVTGGAWDMNGDKDERVVFMREWKAEVGWKLRVLCGGSYVCK